MKLLVTGGAGYIGTELIKVLDEAGHYDEIIIYDNLSRANYNLFIGRQKLSSKVRFVRGDLLDSRTVDKVVKGVDAVVHLAAHVTTPFADHEAHFYEQINHWGTAELVYAIENSDVQSLLYVSSASVYGDSLEAVGHEDPLDPKTFYAISKMRGEQHVTRLQSDDFVARVVRCANVFGYSKSMRFDSVINRFMFDANFSRKLAIHGDGEQYRAFVHIDRAVNVLANLLSSDLPSGAYDLVEENYSIGTIAEVIKDLYPDVEMMFMDQIMRRSNLRVKSDVRLDRLCSIEKKTLVQQLTEFREELAF